MSSSLDRCELYQTSSFVLLFTRFDPVKPGMMMIGALPVAGAVVVFAVAGAVVWPRAATTLRKMQNIIVGNLTLDWFIRSFDASVTLSVTNKDAFSENDITFNVKSC